MFDYSIESAAIVEGEKSKIISTHRSGKDAWRPDGGEIKEKAFLCTVDLFGAKARL